MRMKVRMRCDFIYLWICVLCEQVLNNKKTLIVNNLQLRSVSCTYVVLSVLLRGRCHLLHAEGEAALSCSVLIGFFEARSV